MQEIIKSHLASSLLRTLQLEPSLPLTDALARVVALVSDGPFFAPDLAGVHKSLKNLANNVRCRGVINPTWISQAQDINLYFYLVRTQPGWLQILEKQARSSLHISYYVLYGDWDVLICLHGAASEAAAFQDNITATIPYDWVNFSASQIVLFYRYRTHTLTKSELPEMRGLPPTSAEVELIDRIVDDYNNPETRDQRDELTEAGILLGPTWEFDTPPSSDVYAHVGITLRGPVHNLVPQILLQDLLSDQILRACLVHLVELEQGRPFNYFAKLVCHDLDELDRATDVIESRRVGTVTLGSTTFVVSRGDDQLLRASGQKAPKIVAPDTRGIEDLIQETVGSFGSEAIASFNLLERRLQPAVLDCLRELQEQMEDGCWDDEIDERLSSAFALFGRAVLDGARPGTLHGPVINVSRAVEGAFKHALERMIRHVYGRELGRAQNELKLRSRKFRELTLGNIVAALRTIKTRRDFEFVADVLDDELIDSLERFAEARNRWAHAGERGSNSPHEEIDAARHAFSNGIELIRWLFAEVMPAIRGKDQQAGDERVVADIPQPVDGGSRQFGIFLSHSAADREIADRIAIGLQLFEYPVWYADWSINAGESIVEKINDALSINDTLIVLLSGESVASPWVRREFTTALMDQLAGQDVTVVPILIEECPIPAVLRSIRYIDMRPERFKTGFVDLLQFLDQRRLLRYQGNLSN